MAKLRAAECREFIDAVVEKADVMGVPVSVAVVGPEGHLIAVERMDEAGFITPETAIAKAFTVAAFRSIVSHVPRGEGCQHCGQSGYAGRAGIYELFTIDDVLRDIITREPSLSALRKEAKSQGHLDLAYDGLCKVADGVTTVDEITRVAETQK